MERLNVLLEFDNSGGEAYRSFIGTVAGGYISRQVVPVAIHDKNDVPDLARLDNILNGLNKTLLLVADIHNTLQADGDHPMLTSFFCFLLALLEKQHLDRRFRLIEAPHLFGNENLCRRPWRRLVFHFRAVLRHMKVWIGVTCADIVAQCFSAFYRILHRAAIQIIVEDEHVIASEVGNKARPD